MEVTIVQNLKWPSKISKTNFNKSSVEQTAWILSVSFCCTRCIIGARGLRGERPPDLLGRLYPEQNNVSFVQMLSLEDRPVVKLCSIIAMKFMRNVDRAESLYLSHGVGYTLSNVMSSSQNRQILHVFKTHISFTYITCSESVVIVLWRSQEKVLRYFPCRICSWVKYIKSTSIVVVVVVRIFAERDGCLQQQEVL